MAKPQKTHTLESLYEMTEECGDCRIWKGYYTVNGVPMVYQGGKMVSVRKLIMSFFQKATSKYYSCKCGTPGCVAKEHIDRRTEQQHMGAMNKNSLKSASNPSRRAKISAMKLAQGKLTPQTINEIIASNESGPVLAQKYGVTKTRISQVRRNGSLVQNVWAGLM
jgi:hypothetical protein